MGVIEVTFNRSGTSEPNIGKLDVPFWFDIIGKLSWLAEIFKSSVAMARKRFDVRLTGIRRGVFDGAGRKFSQRASIRLTQQNGFRFSQTSQKFSSVAMKKFYVHVHESDNGSLLGEESKVSYWTPLATRGWSKLDLYLTHGYRPILNWESAHLCMNDWDQPKQLEVG
jgi:hypothetical protein